MPTGASGGITAALSLLQSGFDVHVYEQASRLNEVGAGVQVSPNALLAALAGAFPFERLTQQAGRWPETNTDRPASPDR